MSEHTAADKVAPVSTEEEPANDALHQRMSGYGFESPLPPSLVPPEPAVGSEAGNGSAERGGLGPAGTGPSLTYGYQKPSQAWMAASDAWRTRTEGLPSGVQQTPSEVEQVPPDVEQTPWNVEQVSSDVEEIRLEIEHTQSRAEEMASEVDQTPLGAVDTSPEATAASLRSAPAPRRFWSRVSGSGSPQASAYLAEQTTTESPAPEADPEPAMPDAGSPQPAADPSAPDPHPTTEAESEPDLAPEPDHAPEPGVPHAGAAQHEPETPPLVAPTSPAGSASALPPSPAPAMPDVRLVVQAVQGAEEAAMAYAREIGEARRHLSEAIAHLDRAEAARTLLNRLAAGFDPQASGRSGSTD